MNDEKILSTIVNKIGNYVKNIMGIILKIDTITEGKELIIKFFGGSKGYNYDYINNYFKSTIDGTTTENFQLKINYISFDYINKGLQLHLQISSFESEDNLSFLDYLNNDLLGEIIANLNSYQDVFNMCDSFVGNICSNNDLYAFLIMKNYPEVIVYIKTIETIDRTNYSGLYKDLYFLLLKRGLNIFTSEDTILDEGELFYRLLFYINHPGVYSKINLYMDKDLFIEIMKSYIFPFLGINNIYSIYSATGNINTDYCENNFNYIIKVTNCINNTNSQLSKFQKAILPWIQVNDILTWFMLIDLKKELINSFEGFEELKLLKDLLIKKYKSTKFFKQLLENYDKNPRIDFY